MRGTPQSDTVAVAQEGIIPAHAGNTSTPCVPPHPPRDHPRACGEHTLHHLSQNRPVGSSPRMRGTLPRPDGGAETRGIIPAHAGNTISGRCAYMRSWDHPRACGEHLGVHAFLFGRTGSSPRMRGTQLLQTLGAGHYGIIPAHAGNTTRLGWSQWQAGDHPRACGEHTLASIPNRKSPGSSPRMRGTHRQPAFESPRRGIIPAHAGNTQHHSRPKHDKRDHPRACGEH